jgi:hypothetical protein
MNYPIYNTLFIALLGIILLYSYYYFSQKYPSIIESLWGTIKGKTRQFYFYSIGLCFLCYISIFIYLFSKNNLTSTQIQQITTAISTMIIASMLWMPLSIQYHFHKSSILKSLIIITLLLVSLSAFYLILLLFELKETSTKMKYLQNISLLGSIYFFFQVFVLDFIYWNYAYLWRS